MKRKSEYRKPVLHELSRVELISKLTNAAARGDSDAAEMLRIVQQIDKSNSEPDTPQSSPIKGWPGNSNEQKPFFPARADALEKAMLIAAIERLKTLVS